MTKQELLNQLDALDNFTYLKDREAGQRPGRIKVYDVSVLIVRGDRAKYDELQMIVQFEGQPNESAWWGDPVKYNLNPQPDAWADEVATYVTTMKENGTIINYSGLNLNVAREYAILNAFVVSGTTVKEKRYFIDKENDTIQHKEME